MIRPDLKVGQLARLAFEVFFVCTNITSVIFPDTVQYIGPIAFQNCSSLERIKLPAALTKINAYGTFCECYKLGNLTFLPVFGYRHTVFEYKCNKGTGWHYVALRVVNKANGESVNLAMAKATSGTHRWVRNADADLPNGFQV